MRKLLVCLMAVFAMTATAQEVTTHTVQRGETMETIAEKYNVSVDDIKKANPNMGGIVYVGMKLKIPAATSLITTQQPISQETVQQPDSNIAQQSSSAENALQPVSNDSLDSTMYEEKLKAMRENYVNFAGIYGQFNPGVFSPIDGNSRLFIAFSIGYHGHARIFSQVPLLLNVDFALQYTHDSRESSQSIMGVSVSSETTLNMLTARVNMGLGYGIKIPKKDFLILPEVGLDCHCHFFGQLRTKVKSGNETNSDTKNVFSESDMGKENAWKMLNFGWHAGLYFCFYSTYMGFSYHWAFTKISPNTYMNQANITIGYIF